MGLDEAKDRDREAGLTGGRSNRQDREQQRRNEDEEIAEHFLEHLRNDPAGDTLSHIRENAIPSRSISEERARRILIRLVTAGRVVHGQVRRQHREYPGYHLATGHNCQTRQVQPGRSRQVNDDEE